MAINLIFGRVSLIADDYSQVASRRWRAIGSNSCSLKFFDKWNNEALHQSGVFEG